MNIDSALEACVAHDVAERATRLPGFLKGGWLAQGQASRKSCARGNNSSLPEALTKASAGNTRARVPSRAPDLAETGALIADHGIEPEFAASVRAGIKQ